MAQLKIECHKSWYNNLIYMSEFLFKNYEIPSTILINKRGYALLRISSHKNGVKLKDLIKKLDIPFLKRKWDKFNNKI